jgi:hypothetical protein
MPNLDNEAIERLRAKLLEDTGSEEVTAALLDTVMKLHAWRAPEAGTEDTAALIKALEALAAPQPALKSRWPLLILQAQMRVIRGEIWTASALVLVLGVLVTFGMQGTFSANHAFPMLVFMPMVAAAGVAFLYGPEVDPALEVQLATPASPRLILLARLALLFGVDLAGGVVGSAVLAGLSPELSLWPLVVAWLAPMAFLSALAFLLSVLLNDSLAGAILSIGLWSIHAAARLLEIAGTPGFLAFVPDLNGTAARPWLWFAGLLLGIMALWLAGREEQWLEG